MQVLKYTYQIVMHYTIIVLQDSFPILFLVWWNKARKEVPACDIYTCETDQFS